MTKVKILKETRVLTPAGAIVEVDEITAAWLIGVGAAEVIIEKAVKKPVETRKKKE